MEYSIIFMFGAIIGSFLNVCIYRLPLGKSVVFPRSFCPFCEKQIAWYDNIPLISFLLLRAKCRNCKAPIAFRYFLVEMLTALSGIWLLSYYQITPGFFIYWVFLCSLIVVIFVDIEHQEIPDVISIPGIFIGAALMTIFKLDGSTAYKWSFLNSLAGILIGGGSMFCLGMLGEFIFKKEALGGGDVKLMAMIGAFLGWKFVLLTFFMAPMLGSSVGLFMKIKYKKEIIAYGPYLSMSAIASLFYGDRILKYLFG